MVDNIVSKMIKQHRGLQADLGLVNKELESKSLSAEKIEDFLNKFKKDLSEHLQLENDVFYRDLLIKMKEKGYDITKTSLFIDQMKDLEKIVIAFLDKYKEYDTISKHRDDFKNEFNDLVETLNLRIESEEAGVYAYWGLF